MSLKFYAAPLQGYTESLWRRFHSEVYGQCVDAYLSPFMRIEKGDVRRKDLRDIDPAEASGYRLIPQIIFRDRTEFELLTDKVTELGYNEIDLNLGCPFPLQTAKGRGAGMILRPDVLREIAEVVTRRPEISFSVKMRLGMQEPDEWMSLMEILNSMPLARITMHPRTGRQGYGGELYQDQFGKFRERSVHPVVFNGNLLSAEDCRNIEERFPGIEGLMVGRGLLARPSLAAELRDGCEWSREKRMEYLRKFYGKISAVAADRYCGDTQLLSKLKPFWEYLEPEIGHRALKAINKAGSMRCYNAAVAAALED